MKILIFIILFLIPISTYSQKVVEIGMCQDEIILLNNEICLYDTLYDGTKFIKGMLSDNKNYIYYFLNDDGYCFCVILYFLNYYDNEKFIQLINQEYKNINDSLWYSKDDKNYIWFENYDFYFPLFYIWDKKIEHPTNWIFLDTLN